MKRSRAVSPIAPQRTGQELVKLCVGTCMGIDLIPPEPPQRVEDKRRWAEHTAAFDHDSVLPSKNTACEHFKGQGQRSHEFLTDMNCSLVPPFSEMLHDPFRPKKKTNSSRGSLAALHSRPRDRGVQSLCATTHDCGPWGRRRGRSVQVTR